MKKLFKNVLIILLSCSMIFTSYYFGDSDGQKVWADEENLLVSKWTNIAESWDSQDAAVGETTFLSTPESIIADIPMTGWQANWTSEGIIPGEAIIIGSIWGDNPYQIRSENTVSVVPGKKYRFELTVENKMNVYHSSNPTEKNITILVGKDTKNSNDNLLFKTVKVEKDSTQTFSFNIAVPRNYGSSSLKIVLAYGSYYYSYCLTKEVKSGNISNEDAMYCPYAYAYPTTEGIKAQGTLSFSDISFTERNESEAVTDAEDDSVSETGNQPSLSLDVGDFSVHWQDEFDENSLNRDYWTTQIGNGSLYGLWAWGNNEQEYYKSNNVTVSDGTLKINAKYEKNAGVVGSTTYNFSSGRINTSSHVEVGKGYVEARIKVPSKNGIWPAFWMLGANEERWPMCGEIDIMESHDKTNMVRNSIHYPDWEGNDVFDFYERDNFEKTAWHTYGCYRDGKVCSFYIDRKLVASYDTKDLYNCYNEGQRSVLNDNYYILLNVACGGTLTTVTPGTSLNEVMEVDYVRYYKKINVAGTTNEADEGTTGNTEPENNEDMTGNTEPENNEDNTGNIETGNNTDNSETGNNTDNSETGNNTSNNETGNNGNNTGINETTTKNNMETPAGTDNESTEVTGEVTIAEGIITEDEDSQEKITVIGTDVKAEATANINEEITTKSQSGEQKKNAIDVVILKAIINSQKSLGANVDEDINSWQYEWSDDEDSRLTEINWYDCNLSGNLSFSGLDELTDVNVMNNHLTSLNVGDNLQLKYLFCTDNDLNALSLLNNKKLKYLDCSYNQIEELNVSNNKNIEVIGCGHNAIKTLDVTNNARLRSLQCSNNVTLIGCDENKVIITYDNEDEELIREFTIIDSDITKEMSRSTMLHGRDFYGYQFTPKRSGFYTFYTTGQYDTYGVLTDSSGRILTSNDDNVGLNFGFNYYCEEGVPYRFLARLYSPKESGTVMFNIVNSSGTKDNIEFERRASDVIILSEIIKAHTQNEEEISKSVFSPQYQWSQEADSRLIGINWEECGLTGELGFTGLDALNRLNCKGNHLTKLDLFDSNNLVYLDCSDNDLDSLDITNNLQIVFLNCRQNNLKILDLLYNAKLMYLDCSDNSLEDLELTENTEIWAVYCDDNVHVTGCKESIIHVIIKPALEETTEAETVPETTEAETVPDTTETETMSETVSETKSEETITKKAKKKKKAVETTTAVTVKKVEVSKAGMKKKSAKKLKISIKKLKKVVGYQVRVFTKKSDAKINSNTLVKALIEKNVKTLTVTNKKLMNNKKLYVRVRAYKVVKNRKKYGKWSAIKKVQFEILTG